MRGRIPLDHGDVTAAAERLSVSRGHLSRVLNGQIGPSVDLALAILADPGLAGRGLTLGGLLKVEIPAGLPVGPDVVTARVDTRRPVPDTRTMPMALEGQAP